MHEIAPDARQQRLRLHRLLVHGPVDIVPAAVLDYRPHREGALDAIVDHLVVVHHIDTPQRYLDEQGKPLSARKFYAVGRPRLSAEIVRSACNAALLGSVCRDVQLELFWSDDMRQRLSTR